MLQHLLYLICPSRLEAFKQAMGRLKAERIDGPSITENFSINHHLLGGLTLQVSLLTDVDGVTPYLRQNPVDLLIYDERGSLPDCIEGVDRIRKDVKQLAELWGPDFHFPTSRMVVILNDAPNADHRVFELGRKNVRDVLVAPQGTAYILRWLKDILYHGVIRTNQVAMALSGGAIEGFLYQVGVIHALDQALTERSLQELDAVSGVSSGSIAGSMLVNKVPVVEILKSIHGLESKVPELKLTTLFDFAGTQILKRFTKVSLSMRATPISQWLGNLARSVPTGFFKGDNLEKYFQDIIDIYGKGDSFQDLDCKFFVGVTDQDTFRHVTLGAPPYEDIKMSEAVRASAALPPLYRPKTIRGRHYIDGQVTNSCNLEIVVEHGARLVFIIDPLKPFQTTTAGSADREGGFFGIVQMIKALVSTRFETSLNAVSERFPDLDFMVFQPDEDTARLMAGSPLKARFRTEIIESAYSGTLRKLRERHHVYNAIMKRYGFQLRDPKELQELEGKYHEILNAPSDR